MKVFVAIYADLEAYPPSLNAVLCMARRCKLVTVFQRSIGRACWIFPENVIVRTVIRHSAVNATGGLRGMLDFTRYVIYITLALRKERPSIMLAYDPIPLLACKIAARLARWSGVLWYHNHDTEKSIVNRRLSVGWWACMLGRKSMAGVDVFSLPAMERLEYFPLDTLKSQPVFIPNYPSRGHYTNIERKENYGDIRLVYQGSLGRNHGFEQLIEWLDRKIDDKRWSLTLLGKISGDYKQELLDKAIDYGVGNRFHIREFVPFTDLPAELSKYTIGLALHLPVGVTYTTGGTASNKIYEYAACGLPVVLYDTPHYRNHLGRRFWVDFCQLSWPGFSGAVSRLLAKGDDATNAARMDFELELNYESVFPKAWSIVLNTMSEKLKYNHSNKRNTFFEKK